MWMMSDRTGSLCTKPTRWHLPSGEELLALPFFVSKYTIFHYTKAKNGLKKSPCIDFVRILRSPNIAKSMVFQIFRRSNKSRLAWRKAGSVIRPRVGRGQRRWWRAGEQFGFGTTSRQLLSFIEKGCWGSILTISWSCRPQNASHSKCRLYKW